MEAMKITGPGRWKGVSESVSYMPATGNHEAKSSVKGITDLMQLLHIWKFRIRISQSKIEVRESIIPMSIKIRPSLC